jgi:hypothetical protein
MVEVSKTVYQDPPAEWPNNTAKETTTSDGAKFLDVSLANVGVDSLQELIRLLQAK